MSDAYFLNCHETGQLIKTIKKAFQANVNSDEWGKFSPH